MKKELFNEGWLFYNSSGTALEDTVRGKAVPASVTLPHDAMALEKRDPESPTGNATGFYPYKAVHYLKKLHIDKPCGSVYLRFDGIYMNTSVYVNGALAANHLNGYTPFTADISPYLTEGDNTIKVLVRNSAPSSRWYTGTGIYRDVYILRGGSVHIAPEGVKITTLEADSETAVLSVETALVNRENAVKDVVLRHKIGETEASAPVTLLPNETKSVTLRIELENPGFWSPEKLSGGSVNRPISRCRIRHTLAKNSPPPNGAGPTPSVAGITGALRANPSPWRCIPPLMRWSFL